MNSEIKLETPTEVFSFVPQVINSDLFPLNVKCLILTKIDLITDIIEDFVFDTPIQSKESFYTFTAKDSRKVSIFSLVDFVNPKVKSLMELFENYDGNVIAYTNREFLNTKVDSYGDINFGTVCYILTGY